MSTCEKHKPAPKSSNLTSEARFAIPSAEISFIHFPDSLKFPGKFNLMEVTMEVQKSGPAVQQQGVARGEEVKQSVKQSVGASTISSASFTEEKYFFAAVTDRIAAAFRYIKETIADLFAKVASFFCATPEMVKEAQVEKEKTFLEQLRERFIQVRDEDQTEDKATLREFWIKKYDNDLTLDQRNALIKEEIRDRVQSKPDVEATVEDRFKNAGYVAEITRFVRDLARTETIHASGVPDGRYCFAFEDRYIPAYLQNMISKMKNKEKVKKD